MGESTRVTQLFTFHSRGRVRRAVPPQLLDDPGDCGDHDPRVSKYCLVLRFLRGWVKIPYEWGKNHPLTSYFRVPSHNFSILCAKLYRRYHIQPVSTLLGSYFLSNLAPGSRSLTLWRCSWICFMFSDVPLILAWHGMQSLRWTLHLNQEYLEHTLW